MNEYIQERHFHLMNSNWLCYIVEIHFLLKFTCSWDT